MNKQIKIQIYKMMVKPAVVCGVKLGCDWDGYEQTGCMAEGNINKHIWTNGRASSMENKK